MEEQLWASMKHVEYHCIMLPRIFRGTSIGPSLGREAPADVIFSSLACSPEASWNISPRFFFWFHMGKFQEIFWFIFHSPGGLSTVMQLCWFNVWFLDTDVTITMNNVTMWLSSNFQLDIPSCPPPPLWDFANIKVWKYFSNLRGCLGLRVVLVQTWD